MAINWNQIIKVSFFSLALLFVLSLLATQILGIPPLKGGPIVLVLLIFGVIMFIWNLASKEQLHFTREDLIGLILIIALIVSVFIFLPQVVPEFFSTLRLETMSVIGLS
jgi:hypothetical protein